MCGHFFRMLDHHLAEISPGNTAVLHGDCWFNVHTSRRDEHVAVSRDFC